MNTSSKVGDRSHACLDARSQDTISDAFDAIVSALKDVEGLVVAHERSVGKLKITAEGQSIHVDGHEIPCFIDTIPEMMTSYIIAQLLKIVSANGKARQDAVIKADYNINHKLVVLHAMSEDFHNKKDKKAG